MAPFVSRFGTEEVLVTNLANESFSDIGSME